MLYTDFIEKLIGLQDLEVKKRIIVMSRRLHSMMPMEVHQAFAA